MSFRPDYHSNFEVQETIRKEAARVAGGGWPVKFVTPDGKEYFFARITTQRDEQTFTAHLEEPKKEKKKDG